MAKPKTIHTSFKRGVVPTITFINKAKLSLSVELDKLVRTLQTFLDDCFVPVWGAPAKLVAGTKPKPGTWTFTFFDDPDDPDADGYHDITFDGFPLSKVFVIPAEKSDGNVTVTACHELCEMLIDPTANIWVEGPRGTLWGYEVCDACEEQTFDLDGLKMSDFCYPAWFEKFRLDHPRKLRTQYDYCNKITEPFQLLKGGYAEILRGGKSHDKFGSLAKKRRFEQEDRSYHRSQFRKFGARAARMKARPKHHPGLRTALSRSGA
jgi:hypothetical protein